MSFLRAGAAALVLAAATPVASTLSAQGEQPLLLRAPALSATDICFSFAGDIWLVPRSGGRPAA